MTQTIYPEKKRLTSSFGLFRHHYSLGPWDAVSKRQSQMKALTIYENIRTHNLLHLAVQGLQLQSQAFLQSMTSTLPTQRL